ncbi:hypothetical protein BCh11DRAFT_06358 [Burkholderia sp. Ch1-1]|uniref:Uncharacterized protein n=1 Tax=Paraburkholderia dioscoreae TaxID=2604047 RepID=A0A5Q4ZAL1_9BURK|nr:hypothetical protein [Paraburkholderia dioscoreae]EIF30851.1 hypothetical protein BCh11DRAFT_06358 [Burkholderia sp. Ch1-1]VVD28909.1 conserved protein of unknown function [Paraburkholderia dioscoreae]
MTARKIDYLLLGGGVASATAARVLRTEDQSASIAILCDETLAPYQRPQLTKGFLDGSLDTTQMAIHEAGFYTDLRIELLLGARAALARTCH